MIFWIYRVVLAFIRGYSHWRDHHRASAILRIATSADIKMEFLSTIVWWTTDTWFTGAAEDYPRTDVCALSIHSLPSSRCTPFSTAHLPDENDALHWPTSTTAVLPLEVPGPNPRSSLTTVSNHNGVFVIDRTYNNYRSILFTGVWR